MGGYIVGYIDGRIFNKPENKINQMIGLQSFHMFVFSYPFVSWIQSDTSIRVYEYLMFIMEIWKQHYKY